MKFNEEKLKKELGDITTIDLNFPENVDNNHHIHIFHYPNATSILSSTSTCRIVGKHLASAYMYMHVCVYVRM